MNPKVTLCRRNYQLRISNPALRNWSPFPTKTRSLCKWKITPCPRSLSLSLIRTFRVKSLHLRIVPGMVARVTGRTKRHLSTVFTCHNYRCRYRERPIKLEGGFLPSKVNFALKKRKSEWLGPPWAAWRLTNVIQQGSVQYTGIQLLAITTTEAYVDNIEDALSESRDRRHCRI